MMVGHETRIQAKLDINLHYVVSLFLKTNKKAIIIYERKLFMVLTLVVFVIKVYIMLVSNK